LVNACHVAVIEAAVPQVLGQIGTWPTDFSNVHEVKTFISIAYPAIEAMTFPGLDKQKFQGYVLFHVARQAWEEGRYEMRVVPGSWKRRTLRGSYFPVSFLSHLSFPSHPLVLCLLFSSLLLSPSSFSVSQARLLTDSDGRCS
jgi:hypothetical protein